MSKLESFNSTSTTEIVSESIPLCREAGMQEISTGVFLIGYDKEADIFDKDMIVREGLECLVLSGSSISIGRVISDGNGGFTYDNQTSKLITHTLIVGTPIINIYCDGLGLLFVTGEHQQGGTQSIMTFGCYGKSAMLNLQDESRTNAYIGNGTSYTFYVRNLLGSTTSHSIRIENGLPTFSTQQGYKNLIVEVSGTPYGTVSSRIVDQHFSSNGSLFFIRGSGLYGSYKNTPINNVFGYVRTGNYGTTVNPNGDGFIYLTQ